MISIDQVVLYLFATLMALAILYFAKGFAIVKYVKDYARIKKGTDNIFTALAAMFWISVLWAVVHSTVALLV